MRIVFDTNVIILAFITRGASAEVFEHCLAAHDIYISRHIYREIEAVLLNKFSFPASTVTIIKRFLDDQVEQVDVQPLEKPACRDPDDDLVLACAASARADCLITGDGDLLALEDFEGIMILRPADFWRFEKSRIGG